VFNLIFVYNHLACCVFQAIETCYILSFLYWLFEKSDVDSQNHLRLQITCNFVQAVIGVLLFNYSLQFSVSYG